MKNADHNRAADKWLAGYSRKTLICLVHFKGVLDEALPRRYPASPAEISELLKGLEAGRGKTILYENRTWSFGTFGAGTRDRTPLLWKFTRQKLDEICNQTGQSDQPI